MNASGLSQFANQRYLNLESYRKTGAPIASPLWFAEDRGCLYIYSLANAGKVKRIRNNPKVRIAPCGVRGKTTGEWVGATARIVDQREAALGHELLRKKYGWMKRSGDLISKLMHRPRVVIALQVSS